METQVDRSELRSQIMSETAAQRKPKERDCPMCSTHFTTIGRGIYDKDACRSKAAYLRRKEMLNTSPQTKDGFLVEPPALVTPLTENPTQFIESLIAPELNLVYRLHSLFEEFALTPIETEIVGGWIVTNSRDMLQTLRNEI